MFNIRRSDERGFVDHGWLKAKHSFSFASYMDRRYMGFRRLRVINQDIVQPGTGFSTHPHNDMEIITYVLRGTVEHKDSLGNQYQIRSGEIQTMSAGTGIQHSEHNPSATEELELLQIWILPDQPNHTPRYQQMKIERDQKNRKLRLIASHDGRDGSAPIHQDVLLYSSFLNTGETLDLLLGDSRHAWLQMVRGKITVSGQSLDAGDALAASDERNLQLQAQEDSEFLLFDLN